MGDKEQTLTELQDAIKKSPIIDNHAHNLLRADRQDAYSFLGSLTEAQGDAQNDYPHSLAAYRALKQLRDLYGCHDTATWDELLGKRSSILTADPDHFNTICLADIHTILIDDGIDDEDTVHSYKWHDRFTTGRIRRSVRSETVAADIMKAMYEEGTMPLSALGHLDPTTIWPVFLQAFENALVDELGDDDVAGFKSVVCYRTGLDVDVADDITVAAAGQAAFRTYLKECSKGRYRIQQKGLNDCLVISTCRLIAAHHRQTGLSKPIQFHTGLGDNDIPLLRSNPAYMQSLIAAFPTVPFVILHSSYPYTREAGYLATMYKNAYLDIGEIFPMISLEGQIAAIKQSMELTPFSKLLWSTDGIHFPERFWLANKQFRQVLFRVFKEQLLDDVLSLSEAKAAVHDILFENSNKLYNLNIGVTDQIYHSGHQHAPPRAITSGLSRSAADKGIVQSSSQHNEDPQRQLSSFLRSSHGKRTKYLIVQWVDHLGVVRCRSYPTASFEKLVSHGNRFTVARAMLHVLQDDTVTPVGNSTGCFYAQPDLTTLRPAHYKDLAGAATVIASFKEKDGSRLPECSRGLLGALLDRLEDEHHLEVLIGFEIEVVFLRIPSDKQSQPEQARVYEPIETAAGRAWAAISAAQANNTWPLIVSIVEELQAIGINLESFHAESSPGQYEFVMPPLPLVTAIDILYHTKRAIQYKAHRAGLRATFHPKPFPGSGTGMHAHISLNKTASAAPDSPRPEPAFWSGVLASLPAVCALTLASQASYERLGDNNWSGGTWVAYGTENRETPLRRVEFGKSQERWEVRCLDGMGNTYMALAALVGAGLSGLEEGRELAMKDCSCKCCKLEAGCD